jgi:hypothetical protein
MRTAIGHEPIAKVNATDKASGIAVRGHAMSCVREAAGFIPRES